MSIMLIQSREIAHFHWARKKVVLQMPGSLVAWGSEDKIRTNKFKNKHANGQISILKRNNLVSYKELDKIHTQKKSVVPSDNFALHTIETLKRGY
jgi:hypothetical protein